MNEWNTTGSEACGTNAPTTTEPLRDAATLHHPRTSVD